MHNRALHDSLAAFVEEAAWQLAEEVSGGAEIPFELDATPTRSSPLYCYRPLTGRFIAQRIGMLSRLPSYPFAAQGLTALPDLPTYLQRRGRRVPAGDPRALADSALQAFLGAVWADATDFTFERDRFNAAYAELEEVAYADCELSVVITAVEGLVIESVEVPLGEGLSLVRATTLADAPAGLSDDPHATVAVLALETSARRRTRARERRPPPAPAAERAAAVGRRRAGARADGLGKTDGSAWMAVPLATGLRRPAGDCLLAAEEEDALRAFCGLVSRRTPRAGELAWALRRFELGCERGNAVEALTDWLMAARALFADTDRVGYEGVAERLAAICAELHDRPRLEGRDARGDLARTRGDGRLRALQRRGRRAGLRARRLPACGVARRAVRASGPCAAACRRRAARGRRSRLGTETQQVLPAAGKTYGAKRSRACGSGPSSPPRRKPTARTSGRGVAVTWRAARRSAHASRHLPSSVLVFKPRRGASAPKPGPRDRGRPPSSGTMSVGGSPRRSRRRSTLAASRVASAASSAVATVTRSASAGPRSAATAAGSSSSGGWWTRLITSPPNGIPASRSLRRK